MIFDRDSQSGQLGTLLGARALNFSPYCANADIKYFCST